MSTRACGGFSATGHCLVQVEKTSLEPSATSIQLGNRNTTLCNGIVTRNGLCRFFKARRRRYGESCRWCHEAQGSSSNNSNRAGNINGKNGARSDERNPRESRVQKGQIREEQRLAERKMKKMEIADHGVTLWHVVMNGSMLITCGAGLDIQHIVCGFDSCFITIKNLPHHVKQHEIEELITEQGVDTTFFCIVKTRHVSNEVEAKVMSNSGHGQVIAANLDGMVFQDKVLDTVIDNGGAGTASGPNVNVLEIDTATLELLPIPQPIICGGKEARRQTVARLIDDIGFETMDSEHDACPICFDEVTMPVMLTCGHFYCTACLRHFLSSAMERKTFPLVCSGDEDRCKTPIAIPIIQRYLLQQQFDRLVDMAVTTYIEKQPTKFKYCTTPDCPQVYRCEGGDMVPTCPSCFATVCTRCHKEAHEGITCREREIMTNSKEQERLNEEWALASGAKHCPSCRVLIQKTEGCNHMTCRCGVHLCWLCLKTFPEGRSVYRHMNSVHGGIYEDEARHADEVQINWNGVQLADLPQWQCRTEWEPDWLGALRNFEDRQRQRRTEQEARDQQHRAAQGRTDREPEWLGIMRNFEDRQRQRRGRQMAWQRRVERGRTDMGPEWPGLLRNVEDRQHRRRGQGRTDSEPEWLGILRDFEEQRRQRSADSNRAGQIELMRRELYALL